MSKGKKGLKKRTQDPFARKDWVNLKAPSTFNVREYARFKETLEEGRGLTNPAVSARPS